MLVDASINDNSAKGLAPTAIRKDITLPSLQGVGSTYFSEGLLTRLETKVVGIVET